jgi:hypothetical protein
VTAVDLSGCASTTRLRRGNRYGTTNLSFEKAEAFLDALSLRERYFNDDPSSRSWIFRGQGEASWPLQPTLLRHFDRTPPATTSLVLLKRFAELANRDGWLSQVTHLI